MSADQIIQLYGTSTALNGASANNANITVPFDGTLEAMLISFAADQDADGEIAALQVSENAAEQTLVNDARGVLATVRLQMGLLTSGAGQNSVSIYVPVDRKVDAGVLLYLHFRTNAAQDVIGNVCLYFSRSRR